MLEKLFFTLEMASLHMEMPSPHVEMASLHMEMPSLHMEMPSLHMEKRFLTLEMPSLHMEKRSFALEMASLHMETRFFTRNVESGTVSGLVLALSKPYCAGAVKSPRLLGGNPNDEVSLGMQFLSLTIGFG